LTAPRRAKRLLNRADCRRSSPAVLANRGVAQMGGV